MSTTRRMLLPLGLLTLVCALFITTTAILAGQAFYQPAPLVDELSPQAGCSLPCWHGIIPGETYLSSAHLLMIDAGYAFYSSGGGISEFLPDPSFATARHCRVRLLSTQEERIDGEIDGRIREIRLLGCRGMRLGDAMVVLQIPQLTSAGGSRLSFLDGMVFVYTRSNACTAPRLTPFMGIDAVMITPRVTPENFDRADQDRVDQDRAIAWDGFASHLHYRGVCLMRSLSW